MKAQTRIALSDVAYITMVPRGLEFYQNAGARLQPLTIDAGENQAGYNTLEVNDDHELLTDVPVNKGILIEMESLVDPEKWAFGKELISSEREGLALEIVEDGVRKVLSRLNSHLLVLEHYSAREYGPDKGSWELHGTDIYAYYQVHLNGTKSIFVLTDGHYQKGYLVFTGAKPHIDIQGTDFSNAEVIRRNEAALFNDPRFNFNPEDHFFIKEEGNAYSLRNIFGDPLVESLYDSIRFMGPLTVLHRQGELLLYTPDLKRIPLENVRAAYFYFPTDRRWLQVLDGNTVKTIDYLGNETGDMEPEGLLVCGTVPVWRYVLDRKQNKLVYQSAHTYFKSEYGDCEDVTVDAQGKKEAPLPGREAPAPSVVPIVPVDCHGPEASLAFLAADHISFANNTYQVNYNGNSGYGDLFNLQEGLLRIRKDGQYGLAAPELLREGVESILKIKLLLPVGFDKIEYISETHPLLLVKNDRYAWYPMSKEPRYSKLSPFDHHFSRYELSDGRKGWIDLTGNQYPDL